MGYAKVSLIRGVAFSMSQAHNNSLIPLHGITIDTIISCEQNRQTTERGGSKP